MADREEVAEWEVANEFAVVRVRRRRTRNGERIEIEAPRLGRRIALCPLGPVGGRRDVRDAGAG
jgi:hypothetical protein